MSVARESQERDRPRLPPQLSVGRPRGQKALYAMQRLRDMLITMPYSVMSTIRRPEWRDVVTMLLVAISLHLVPLPVRAQSVPANAERAVAQQG